MAIVILNGVKPLDVGIPSQVFSTRASMPYVVDVCGVRPGPVSGADGLSYRVEHGLEALMDAELIFVPGYRKPHASRPPEALLAALRAAHDRGSRIAAISTGAFALAAAGLLDGRRATTHWHYARFLAAHYPDIEVDEKVLFVDEGTVLTSAGAASGIDLCLHILRQETSVAVANHAARRLVAAPYRSGGQAQYIMRSVPDLHGEQFTRTREWALGHLDESITISRLAQHARVSTRTFSRRFRDQTGYTPMQWIMRARLDQARLLLEETDLPIESIAQRVGMGTAANLRRHFFSVLATTPTAYRRAFAAG